jgi:hypothetical protein
MLLSLFQYNIISYLLLLPVLLNMYLWESSLTAMVFGGLFVFFQSILWGQSICKQQKLFFQIIFGLLVFLTTLLVLGTIIYFPFSLSTPAATLVFLLLPLVGTLLLQQYGFSQQGLLELPPSNIFDRIKRTKFLAVLGSFYLLISAWIYKLLLTSATTEAIRTPWDVIPSHFWILYFTLTILAFILLQKLKSPFLQFILTANHLFLSTSITLFIYSIGYGFDPFLHQAAESIIDQQGSVLPKTPYYLGQYSLVVLLHKLLGFSLLWIDRLLVPVLFSLGAPLLIILGLDQKERVNFSFPLTWLALILLVVPFSALLVTTPQGLGNVFFLFLVISFFTSFFSQSYTIPNWLLVLFTLAALMTHPLVGIPAFILLALGLYEKYKDQLSLPQFAHRLVLTSLFVLGSVSASAMFLLNSAISKEFTTSIKPLHDITLADITAWLPLQLFPTESQYRSFFYEFGYFFSENIWWLLTAFLLLASYWLLMRSKYSYFRVFALLALILIVNATLVSAALSFPELIQYETQEYSRRLFTMAYWAMMPFLFIAFIWAIKSSESRPRYNWVVIFLLSSFITGSLFTSYPRNNKYELGRQYSVSESDILTVNKIAEDKNGYVVLANQSVSAAAIKEHGFKTYFEAENGQSVFYYPVPTSSPLYSVYLDMVYDAPTKENALQAKELAGDDVDTVYFVLNKYWDNSSQIAEQAKLIADEWVEINDGEIVIFVYEF